MEIDIGPDVLHDFKMASRQEWLVTNGLGGYASGSLSGANTRRYHGLLVAATTPPTVRRVFVGQLDATVTVEGRSFELGANQYSDAIHPTGYRFLEQFHAIPAPTFRYSPAPGYVLEKRIWMDYGRNTTYVCFTLISSPQPIEIRLMPLICDKCYHTQMSAMHGPPHRIERLGGAIVTQWDSFSPVLRIEAPFAKVDPANHWNYRIVHESERERGLDYHEDLYSPGSFYATLEPGESITLIATIEDGFDAPDVAWNSHIERQNALLEIARPRDEYEMALVLAADAFLIDGVANNNLRLQTHVSLGSSNSEKGASRSTIIAGYPWFTDWGRDTMISLPGLCLETGRHEVARDILLSYGRYASEGMIPNRFTDNSGEPEYNTADASLWYINAGWEYLQAMPCDSGLLKTIWPTWKDIIDWHVSGTRYGIALDTEDGLLYAGEPGQQLTWMDARVGDWVVTPRIGKPVEINALWYNAARIMENLAPLVQESPVAYARLAEEAMRGFKSKFVRTDGHGLFDLHGTDGPDEAIRPNQIFAVSLPFSPLTSSQQHSVVKTVEEHLLTPVGLRTLAPTSPSYRPRYCGNWVERDGAYHQGTVWPWLMGPFVIAHLKLYNDPAAARRYLMGIRRHLQEAGVGNISEIFDGDAPHLSNGCIAQAWSVAETLRALSSIRNAEEKAGHDHLNRMISARAHA